MNPFSTANLALVAYAYVKSDGTSPDMNSGMTTTRLGIGSGAYQVTLPGSETVQPSSTLQEGQFNDLILVTPNHGQPLMVSTGDSSEFVKQINFSNNSSPQDSAFAIVILRSTIPRPTGSDGNQNGPL